MMNDSESVNTIPEHPTEDITLQVENSETQEDNSAHSREASGVTDDPASHAISLRKQPLMELVYSEEGYVRRLKTVRDNYIPVISLAKSQSLSENSSLATAMPEASLLKESPPFNPPVMPDDLAARWRIVWGNWIQLFDWHSTFLERLRALVDSEPDKIPKLFIDSRSRLRLIYSKYCENHRKAALIADQHREYFEELRNYLNDKEDVVSYLIQPVQRIMRYQLPMAEIVKYTERAALPALGLWRKALDIMKEIPKDAQLILEAARIDGFPGVITALGSILIRGNLLVATSTREQLMENVAGYKAMLQETTRMLGIVDPSSPANKMSTFRAHFNRLTHSSSPSTPDTLPVPAVAPTSGEILDSSELYVGSFKFVESRLFLFEQMLVVTEEIKPKRRAISSDAFAHSTFQFKVAINVNKMRFEPHWYNCSLPNGLTNADATAVDQLLSLGVTPEDLRFAVQDQTPGRDFVYVIDPTTLANREAWVVQLRDIQRMQHEFLLALQDPKRFNAGNRDDNWEPPSPSASLPPHPEAHPPVISVHKNVSASQPRQRQQKWPSFTMRRSNRLGSASSSNNSAMSGGSKKDATHRQQQQHNLTPTTPGEVSPTDRNVGTSLSRSLSAERSHGRRAKQEGRASICEVKMSSVEDSTEPKSPFSDGDQSVAKFSKTSLPSQSGGDGRAGNVVKMRSVFANLFGRNKSKQRIKSSSDYQSAVSTPQTETPVDVQTAPQSDTAA